MQYLCTAKRILKDETIVEDDTLSAVKGFIRTLKDFEFVFMLNTYDQIFSETDVVFDIV